MPTHHNKKIGKYRKKIEKEELKIEKEELKMIAEKHGIKLRNATDSQLAHFKEMHKHMNNGESFEQSHNIAVSNGFPFYK